MFDPFEESERRSELMAEYDSVREAHETLDDTATDNQPDPDWIAPPKPDWLASLSIDGWAIFTSPHTPVGEANLGMLRQVDEIAGMLEILWEDGSQGWDF